MPSNSISIQIFIIISNAQNINALTVFASDISLSTAKVTKNSTAVLSGI